MPTRKLVVSAAIVDVDQVEPITRLLFVAANVIPDTAPPKISLQKMALPVIAFEQAQLSEAQALLAKLWEVAQYPDNQSEIVVCLADQHIVHVDDRGNSVASNPTQDVKDGPQGGDVPKS